MAELDVQLHSDKKKTHMYLHQGISNKVFCANTTFIITSIYNFSVTNIIFCTNATFLILVSKSLFYANTTLFILVSLQTRPKPTVKNPNKKIFHKLCKNHCHLQMSNSY